jgi:purine-binding chemotaxis protein CheW
VLGKSEGNHSLESGETRQYVTATVGGQLFGIPILQAQDILQPQQIAVVPCAPDFVAGVMNLRGHIVTAIDVRRRLGLDPADRAASPSVVIEHQGEQYGLLVDEIGDILEVPVDRMEANPPTLDRLWGRFSGGVCRLDSDLMIVLDADRLLDGEAQAQAA